MRRVSRCLPNVKIDVVVRSHKLDSVYRYEPKFKVETIIQTEGNGISRWD